MFLALLACTTPPVDDTNTDTVTESDTDTDTDSDTDADVETLDATLIASVTNGPIECGFTNTLHGTSIVGECDGCDFAFELEDTISDEWGDCATFPGEGWMGVWGLRSAPNIPAGSIAHYAEFYDVWASYDYRDPNITDALVHTWGWSYNGYEAYYDIALAYAESTTSSFTRDGDQIEWHFAVEEPTYFMVWPYFEACYSATYMSYEEPLAVETQSSITCPLGDGDIPGDLWDVTLEAGRAVTISVDTVDPEAEAMFAVYAIAPDGCLAASGDWGSGCAGGTERYCAAVTFTPDTSGVYALGVTNWGYCDTSEATYGVSVIDVSTGEPLDVTQTHNDVIVGTLDELLTTYTIDMVGTISR